MRKMLFLLPVLAALASGAQAQTTAAPAAAPASAPEPTPSPLTANIALTSNYKFRGQDQGNNKAAIQGGFDYTWNGFYVGNWNSSIGFTNAGIEMDFYGGYKGEIAKDVGYDVGLLQYYYPQKDKSVSYHTLELYGAVSYQWLSLKYSHTISQDYFGYGESFGNGGVDPKPSGRNTGYLDLSANYPISEKITLNGHVGYTHYSSGLRNASLTTCEELDSVRVRPLATTCTTTGIGLPNYTDWKIGLTYDLGSGFSLSGAVVGATKTGYYGDVNHTRAIATISKSM